MVLLEIFSKAPPFDNLYDEKDPKFIKQIVIPGKETILEPRKIAIKEAICKV